MASVNDFDVLVRGGRVVTPRGIAALEIGVRDGTIAALAPALPGARSGRVIDAGGRLVLPGIVDSHVHVRDPGLTHKEDFTSCSRGAASSGVTTMLCMPNTDPLLDSAEGFRVTAEAARTKSLVDFGLQALAVPGNTGALADLAGLGVTSFEVFLAGPPSMLTGTPAERLAVFAAVAAVGGIAGVYADDGTAAGLIEARGQGRPADIVRAHSPELEVGTLLSALAMAAEASCRVHFRQLSSALAVEAAAWARRHTLPGRFSAETTPHHLSLTLDDFVAAGTAGHALPPLRHRADVDAIWDGLRRGEIDTIGTDHAPHAWTEKAPDAGDLRKAAGGFPGVETFVPAMLTEFARRGLSPQRFVRLAAENPARLFGLYPRKGVIAEGADADLAIVDDSVRWTVDPARFHSKARYSPYAGKTMTARVDLTMLRGAVIFEDGELRAEPGNGRLVTPAGRGA